MTAPWLQRAVLSLEHASQLDGAVLRARAIASRAVPAGRLRQWALGEPLGHPAHPVVVTIPLGAWTSASVLDLLAVRRPGGARAAQTLVGFGVLTAAPAALLGAAEWLEADTVQARRVGLVHAVANSVALAAYSASWLSRARGRHGAGVRFALAGATAMSAGGWLGGHLSYVLGVGQRTEHGAPEPAAG